MRTMEEVKLLPEKSDRVVCNNKIKERDNLFFENVITNLKMLADSALQMRAECAQWECGLEAVIDLQTIYTIDKLVLKAEERMSTFKQASTSTDVVSDSSQIPVKGFQNIECVTLTPQETLL